MKVKEYVFLIGLLTVGMTLCLLAFYQTLSSKPASSTSALPYSSLSAATPVVTPTAVMNEPSEDSNAAIEAEVDQVATAIEACFTYSNGSYARCTSIASLQSQGFIRAQPTHTIVITPTTAQATDVLVYATLQPSAICQFGSGQNKYFVYRSTSGGTRVECSTSTPILTSASPTPAYPTPFR